MDENIRNQINRIQQECEILKPLVVIQCTTYNHESYIAEALEGFVMQKTDFPFVAIVHDDASTDNTAAIIKEYAEKYPEIIKPIYESENQYSKHDGSLGKIMDEACIATGAKYVALCEGDDYWIDSLKLQKQVDFLENNTDYGLVHTNFKIYDVEKNEIFPNGSAIYDIPIGYVFNNLFKECFIKTLTVCLRMELLISRPVLPKGAFNGDRFIFFEVALNSKIYYLNEETSMYRLLSDSASHITNPQKLLNYYKGLEKLDKFYIIRGNAGNEVKYMVEKKWFITYLKHYICYSDYNSFSMLNNNKYITFKTNPILYTLYKILENKTLFFLCGKLWRYKRKKKIKLG